MQQQQQQREEEEEEDGRVVVVSVAPGTGTGTGTGTTFELRTFPRLGHRSVGFHLYDASVLLARFLTKSFTTPRLAPTARTPRTVLELGAGCTGLVGLTLRRLLRTPTVTLTDLPELLPYLQKTVQRNLTREEAAGVDVRPLDWFAPHVFAEKFDVVVAADCVYMKRDVDALVSTITATCGKEAWVCCELREEGLTEWFEERARVLGGLRVKRVKPKDFADCVVDLPSSLVTEADAETEVVPRGSFVVLHVRPPLAVASSSAVSV